MFSYILFSAIAVYIHKLSDILYYYMYNKRMYEYRNEFKSMEKKQSKYKKALNQIECNATI